MNFFQTSVLNKHFKAQDSLAIKAAFTKFKAHFDNPKLTTILLLWYDLDFREFLNELKKVKIELSLSNEVEWMHYFNEKSK